MYIILIGQISNTYRSNRLYNFKKYRYFFQQFGKSYYSQKTKLNKNNDGNLQQNFSVISIKKMMNKVDKI